MKRFSTLALVLALALLPFACADADASGQLYETFVSYYDDDLTLINDQENLYLLPLVLSKSNSGKDDGIVYYDVNGDVLSVTVTVNISGYVEECDIRLTVPSGISYGDSEYTDYISQNYHCLAFQMAMDTNAEAADRYPLIAAIRDGLSEGGGVYECGWDDYTVNCTLADGTVETIFTLTGPVEVEPTPSPVPDLDSPEDQTDGDEYIG
jgi:hypothetical protein